MFHVPPLVANVSVSARAKVPRTASGGETPRLPVISVAAMPGCGSALAEGRARR